MSDFRTAPDDVRWFGTLGKCRECRNAATGQLMGSKERELLAAEADRWWETVSDGYRPGMSEPRTRYVDPGSKAVFSIGDCRRAKRILSGASR